MNNIKVLTDMDVILFTTYNFDDGFFKDGKRHKVSIDEREVVESTDYSGVFAINVLNKPKPAQDYIHHLYEIIKELVPTVERTTLVIHDKDLCETFSQSDIIKVRDEYGNECYTVITFKHTTGKMVQLLDNNHIIIKKLTKKGHTVQDFIDEIVQTKKQHT